jgi:NAD(P)-dependent dehydrogenase (short-subunit alcohol dehydrogenase family)
LYAAPLMAQRRNGLIVFTSSFGGNCYMHGAAYGAQKAGVDKFAKDMAVDLRPYDVAAVSIWMGMLRTDRTKRVMDSEPQKYAGFWDIAESPEYTGHVIGALFRDPKRAEKSGQVLIGAELGAEYGLLDEGRTPISHRPMLGAPPQAHPAVVE